MSQQSQPSLDGQPAEDGTDGTKWTCGYCTYNNWPLTAKCTICRMPKPIQNLRIEDAVATMSSPYADMNSSDCPQMELERWACLSCTYLNWPRSRKCVQCQMSKPSPATRKISVDCVSSASSDGEAPKQAISPGNRNSSSPPLSSTIFQPCSPGTSTPQLDSTIVARKLQKWTCNGCTYQNWPKTPRCVMCYTPRPGLAISPRMRSAVQSPNAPSSPQAETNSGSQSPTGSRDKKRVLQDESGYEGTGRKSPKSSGPPSVGSSNENLAAAAPSPSEGGDALDRHLRRLRHQPNRTLEFLWLNAVRSVVSSSNGDADHVEAYLAAGGDPSRQLTNSESQMLERAHNSCVFEVGHTLLLLALRYQRDDIVTLLLGRADMEHNASDIAHGSGGGRIKRVPCYVSPDTAANIRRSVAMSLRQRKGELPCFYFSEITTFALPASIYELTPPALQRRLFDEVLDRGVQKELEEECAIINWSLEVTDRLSSRLFALWNRTAGDCLLDSVLQATWGVFDSENSLRQALADSLTDAAQSFYPRWREYETLLAKGMQYSLDENQFIRDWDYILKLASKPGSALEQAHVFALAHIVRRPIIVYGVRIVKSYRGEHLDYARFEGVYLPLLWESSFCSRSPICLGYTRGHFVALAPMEPPGFRRATRLDARSRYVHLPLQDGDGKLLPVHFIG
uniref:ubiquitinyl hydrolase 1 n=1 Tax=Plectus sambesii TaxID=2011161 RepID=A0A914VPE7_9BILA